MKHHGVKRTLAIFVSILMVLSVFPFGALTAFAENGAAADDWASLQEAFNEGGVVALSGNVTAPAGAAALTASSLSQTELHLNGYTIDRALTEETDKGSVIIVNGDLDIYGPGTITGGNTSGSGGGLWVKRDGSLALYDGVVVSDNYAKYTGGGVYVSGSNANFCLYDGASITNNSAKNGGGLAQDSTGSLHMLGGSISDNTATNNGGGVWYGGGTYSSFELQGGVISGNRAGNDGGGVYANRSVFDMGPNSSISGNTAERSGGGVFIGSGVFEPEGTISGNTAPTDPEIGAKDGSSIPSYTVTIDGPIANGTVTADKASAKYGEVVTLTVTPASEDYVADYLTVNDASGSPVALSDNSFVMPKSNVSVSAAFREIREFRVETQEYDSSTDHGRVYLNDHHTDDFVYEGSTVTAFADPDSGLIATSWTVLMQDELSREYIYTVPDVSHPTPNTISFTMPSADVLVSATFSESHDQRLVFFNDMEGGTVVSDKTLVGQQDDELVTLTIQPGNGYAYVPDSLRLVEVDRDGMSQLDITGYMNTVTENSVYSINIGSNDLYVYASFEKVPAQPKHCVVVDGETENGTISADYDLAEVGWTVKVTANPDAYRGYAVRNITVTDEDGTAYPVTDRGYNEYTFTMPATDVFVTAEFGIPVYTITANSPTAEPTGCELDVVNEAEVGDDVTVWILVPDGRSMESLTVAGDITDNIYDIRLDYHKEGAALYRYKFTMPGEPVTVTAVFGTMKHPITVNEAVEGTVTFTVNGEAVTEAAYGENVNVSYVYENRTGTYEDLIDSVTYSFTMNGATARRPLDGLTITDGVCTGSFSMPAASVEIGASYSSPYTVSVADVQDGSIDASVNGVPHFATFHVYPDETVMLSAISSLSEKVRADWRVVYTDETGEHSVAVTRISDREASFLMPTACVTVSAELTPLGVPYMARSWNSANATLTEQIRYYAGEYTNLSSVTNNTLSDGWYVLDGSLTFGNRITVSGSVRLILTDGMTLTAEEGIRVPEGATLRIYGQANDSGKLIATADGYNAAIGSNDEDDGDEDAAGTIIIYGGTIEATGDSDAAGIGGGNEAGGGNVTVYGGTVTATGGDYGAGIGSGDEPENGSAGSYTQYGGIVTADGGKEAAGVGGGNDGDGGTVTIWGGKLEATGCSWGQEASGAGIGGGDDGDGGTVTIYGGNVTAEGDYRAAGIGGGEHGMTGTVTINGGEVNATGGALGAGIGTGDGTLHTEMNENTGSVTINGGRVYATGGYYGAGIGGGNKAGGVTITINDGYVNAKGTGRSSAGAGIGSGYNSGINADITIHGGTVIATGGTGDSEYVNEIQAYGAAGIGTGDYGGSDNNHTGRIIITGGTVSAYGGRGAAGIGGGYHSPAEIVEISGGTVSASGSSNNDRYSAKQTAGIGCGAYGDEEYGSVTITGGTVSVSSAFSTDSSDAPYAIGISKGCDESDMPAGFLTLGSKMCVRPTVNDAPVVKADRVAACMKGHRTAVISECDHPQATYTATADTHLKHCAYCYTAFTAGDHTFAGDDHICSVCGYQYGGVLFTVSFEGNGGEGSMDSVSVIPNDRYDLPANDFNAPEGKVFGGWAVAIDGETVTLAPGDPITVDEDKTVAAVWENVLYPIMVEDAQHGAVTADKETAAMGETVTLTVTPEAGYRLAALTATDANGAPIDVTENSFTMPASGVTVTAAFEEKTSFTLTVYWSSVVAPDSVPSPVIIDDVQAGTTVEQAMRDANYTVTFPPFEKAGFEGHNLYLPQPMTAYASFEELYAARLNASEIEADTTVYYAMFKQIDTVELSISAPVCGTSTAAQTVNAPWNGQTNAPTLQVPQDAHYAPDTAGGTLAAWWLAGNASSAAYVGSFTGGSAYYAGVALRAEHGYCFRVNEEALTVDAGTLDHITSSGGETMLEAVVCLTAVHVDGEEGVITTRPTAAAPTGEMTYYCTVCGQPSRTQPYVGEVFAVTVSSNMTGGSVTVSQPTACEGETITLTVTPGANCLLDTLTVADADGEEIEVTDNKFTMPAKDVTVTSRFYETYKIRVGGVQVTSKNKADVLGDGSVVYEGDQTEGTLYLTDANITGAYYEGSIAKNIFVNNADLSLTIVLSGENSVSGGHYAFDIACAGVTLTGEGLLNAHASSEAFYFHRTPLTIDTTTVNAEADNSFCMEIGSAALTIRDSSVTAVGGGNMALDAKDVTIVNSTIDATAGYSYAIYGSDSIRMTDSTVTATSKNQYAVYAGYEEMTITGSVVTASSEGSEGIYVKRSLTVTDSTVETTGWYQGLTVDGALTLEGDTELTVNGRNRRYAALLVGSLEMDDDFVITTPENAVVANYFGDAYDAVWEADGTTLADKVVIRRAYHVSINDAEQGTVTTDRASAFKGDTITVTATPADGYMLASLTVTTVSGESVTVTDGAFVMPREDVVITAAFACPHASYTLTGWSWAEDYSSATATFACGVCGDTVRLTDNAPVKTQVSPATPAADEVICYTATVTFNEQIFTDKTGSVTVPGTADQAAADAAETLIDAIGTVEYSDACKAKIDEASDAFDALTDAQKALVTNAQKLTDAIARYAELKAAADQAAADQAAADAVIGKINAIGTVEYTAESKAKIDDARTAYNDLTQTQKALVANYGVLEAAEARYADLKAAAEAPTNPTNPDQPSGGSGKCKWCGKDHTANFWQRIVGFWHMIFYFWAHLFGLK